VWLNLENAYRLHTTPDPDRAIERRAAQRVA
jgi:plasmid maintenance system antidote protein VapI